MSTLPDFFTQTAEPMTEWEGRAWFKARWSEMHQRGATWARFSVDNADNPTIRLCEGWRVRPDREPPQFFMTEG